MIEDSSTTVPSESEGTKGSCDDGVKTIELELDIFGRAVRYGIDVADKQARLADIVPIARTVCSKVAVTVLEKLREDGEAIPCHKGCSACCHYLTSLSVPEAFRLSEELLAMPAESGKAVLESYLEAAKKILDNMPEDFDITSEPTQINEQAQMSQLSSWYAGLELACPFLSDNLCTIYDQRPTACRENIVTGSAEMCKVEGQDGTQVVKMPVSVTEALARLAADLEQSSVEAVMLPLALPWAEENQQRGERTWLAPMMVEKFVDILKEMTSKTSAAVVEPA
ncbi:MAG: YkgJ family cysteine cluster protein [Planctomycetota bacterium]|jgi:Fe-S-cluster containining protein